MDHLETTEQRTPGQTQSLILGWNFLPHPTPWKLTIPKHPASRELQSGATKRHQRHAVHEGGQCLSLPHVWMAQGAVGFPGCHMCRWLRELLAAQVVTCVNSSGSCRLPGKQKALGRGRFLSIHGDHGSGQREKTRLSKTAGGTWAVYPHSHCEDKCPLTVLNTWSPGWWHCL